MQLGFDGFNSASSANIATQTAAGAKSGTLTVTGQVDQGASANKGMRLQVALASGYLGLVNKLSGQCTTKLLVKPNDLAGSYLMNKLNGSGMCSGSQMPKIGTSLPMPTSTSFARGSLPAPNSEPAVRV